MQHLIFIVLLFVSCVSLACEPMCTLEARDKAVELENHASDEFKKSISSTLDRADSEKCHELWHGENVNTLFTVVLELESDGAVKTTWTSLSYVKDDSDNKIEGKKFEDIEKMVSCIAREAEILKYMPPPVYPYYIFRDFNKISYKTAVKMGLAK